MNITNGLKFGFSLLCRVLLLAFFSYLFSFRVLFWFVLFCFFSAVMSNWEYDEYFAWGCISESNNYYLYMLRTSLRREPIRGHQNCSKCLLTIVYLNSFSLLNSSKLIVNQFQLTAKANEKLNFLFKLLSCFSDTAQS